MTLILPQRGYDHTTRTFLAENQLEQDERYFITLDNSVIALVENGLGCSIMPELVLQNCTGNYKALPLENNIYRTIALATVRGKSTSLAGEKMIQEIRNQVKLF